MRSYAAPAALWLALAGCAGLAGLPPRLPDCPGAPFDPALLPGGDFSRRAQVRVEGEDVSLAFGLQVERRGDQIVLVGFDAFGVRVFQLVQRGGEVESESRLGGALGVSPETLLHDLRAAHFLGPAAGNRVEVRRPGCAHSATFVRVP